MAQSLEQYIAEATNAYAPAKTAVQTQLGSLDSNFETGKNKINTNYQSLQDDLVKQRNWAAEDASMAAAARGSGFGGQAEAAARNYYEKTFVPAQTSLQRNQANEIDALRQNIENQRTSLNSQLANLDAQANQQALQQYWAAIEAEKQREAQLRAQREAQAAQNAYNQRIMEAIKNNSGGGNNGTKAWDFGDGYQVYADRNGNAVYTRDGQQIKRGEFLTVTGANGANWDLWNDIWNNGVRTNGVGGDTVSAFDGMVRSANNRNDNRYSYLW